jgi:general secretion pathway protein G
MMTKALRSRRPRGFTLLELGIVLGVAAILAAAVAPDFIESMRNKMAEKAAADVALVHDAARWFYLESGRATGTYRWPGENGFNECTNNYQPGKARFDLLINGYLAGGGPADPLNAPPNFLRNPWGQGYDMVLIQPPPTVMQVGCLFGIATNLPEAVSDGFIAFLPQAACNTPAGSPCPPNPSVAVPAGMRRCCSFVPKPGVEMWRDVCNGNLPQRGPGNQLICP